MAARQRAGQDARHFLRPQRRAAGEDLANQPVAGAEANSLGCLAEGGEPAGIVRVPADGHPYLLAAGGRHERVAEEPAAVLHQPAKAILDGLHHVLGAVSHGRDVEEQLDRRGALADAAVENLVHAPQLHYGLAAISHVAGVQDNAPHSRIVQQVRGQDPQPAPRAVARRGADLHLGEAARLSRQAVEHPPRVGQVLRMDELEAAAADQLAGGETQRASDGGGLVGDGAGGIDDGDIVAALFGQGAEAALAELERLFGGMQRGDVGNRDAVTDVGAPAKNGRRIQPPKECLSVAATEVEAARPAVRRRVAQIARIAKVQIERIALVVGHKMLHPPAQ